MINKTNQLAIIRMLVACVAATLATAYGQPLSPNSIYPVRDGEFSQSLNGEWSFKYAAGSNSASDADFYKPQFGDSKWKTIEVPSNWELKDFAEPQYEFKLKAGLGLYRRTFRLPAKWQRRRRTFLRFDGVAYGFKAWVNGKPIGESIASAYNPHTFDISDLVRRDSQADNMLAVEVTTKPLGFEFDINDDWSLSGIFRDVTVFSLPPTHFAELFTTTKLAAEGSAELAVEVKTSGSGSKVAGRLIAPDGTTVDQFSLENSREGIHGAKVRIQQPELWSAETPALYRLQLALKANGETQQVIDERIGLREISIRNRMLLLNGRPIKLRGVNHHDLSPVNGRAVTPEETRSDLEMMREGNVNFVRTSHYPPSERLLDLCDELGFYVMDEVAIGRGAEHLNKPNYRELIMERARFTVTRDKNHASVIIWSIGNEKPISESEMDAGRMVKKLDPTRPICIPKVGRYFDDNYQRIPAFVDIYAPHYPNIATLRKYAETLERPVILTEYAHALGLATDRIQQEWSILQTTPHFAGGAIWHFMDQGILRRSSKPVNTSKDTPYAWPDAHHYYDTDGLNGGDGVVYSDRSPQTDFWQMRKVYSPVQILDEEADVDAGDQRIPITVENRYDFRSLTGMSLLWSLKSNGNVKAKGEVALGAPARSSESVTVPVKIPVATSDDILTLDLACVDESGSSINEDVVRLNPQQSDTHAWAKGIPPVGRLSIQEAAGEIIVASPAWRITVSKETGQLTITDASGARIVNGIYPRTGRELTLAEELSAKIEGTWKSPVLRDIQSPQIRAIPMGDRVKISVSGRYPRPGLEDQAFIGGYELIIQPSGIINIRYEYRPEAIKGKFAELGLSIDAPAELTEFRWIGDGPYAGYPGKDRLNEFGIFHLNRADLYYQGNRPKTELAVLTSANGVGLALLAKPTDVAIERVDDITRISHNLVVAGLGNKGRPPEKVMNAEDLSAFSGTFTLVILNSQWPESLVRWFGKPAPAKNVYQPFHHSYDQ